MVLSIIVRTLDVAINLALRDIMLVEEIIYLTAQLSCTVQQKSRLDQNKNITRGYIEQIADENKAIKHHVAREQIIDRVFFDV